MPTKIKIVIGIDMGATHTRFCLLDSEGKEKLCNKQKTSEIIKTGLISTLNQLIDVHNANAQQIMIGFPAMVTKDEKTIISAPNLLLATPDLHDLKKNLSSVFRCPVYFSRDVNLQLYWDVYQYHLEKQIVLATYLGSGMGFAVWMNGMPWLGAHGFAGELGHIPYGDMSQHCNCGNSGCLETVCSGIALYNWYKSSSRDFPLESLFLHCQQQPFVQKLLTNTARAIATTINLFDPDTMILGGGVMDMPGFPRDLLIADIRRYLRHPLPASVVQFISATSSNYNGARGAARLALQRYKKSSSLPTNNSA